MKNFSSPAQFARVAVYGIFSGALLHSVYLKSLGVVFVCVAFCLLLLIAHSRYWLVFSFLFFFCGTFAIFDFQLSRLQNAEQTVTGLRMIEGTVLSTKVSSRQEELVVGNVEDIDETTRHSVYGTMIVTHELFSGITPGDRIRVSCKFSTLGNSAFAVSQKFRLHAVGQCKKSEDVTVVSSSFFEKRVAFTQQKILDTLSLLLPSPESAFAAGLLIGATTISVPADVQNAFRVTGTSHILAASGFNVSVTVRWCVALLLFAGIPRRLRIFLSFFFIWTYVAVAGFSAAVIRAGTMSTSVLVSQFLGRPSAALHTLLVSAGIMLLLNPFLLGFDVGFELTLTATFGMLVVGPALEIAYPHVFGGSRLRQLLTETAAAVFTTTPLILWRFGTLSLVSLVANLFIVPLIPFCMMLVAVFTVLAMVIPFAIPVFRIICYIPTHMVMLLVDFFSRIPFASVNIGVFPFVGMVVCYGLLFYLCRPLKNIQGKPRFVYEETISLDDASFE